MMSNTRSPLNNPSSGRSRDDRAKQEVERWLKMLSAKLEHAPVAGQDVHSESEGHSPRADRNQPDRPQPAQRNMVAVRRRARDVVRAGWPLSVLLWNFLINPKAGLPTRTSDMTLSARLGNGLDFEFRRGLRVLVIGLGVVGVWGALVPLSAAIVLAGTLVVQSNVKKIQHPTGGIVSQILVGDGMHVKEGDLLVRLDATQVRANRQVITQQLNEVRVRIIRLIAERDGADKLSVPPELGDDRSESFERLLTSEQALFKARAIAKRSQEDLLRNRIVQLNDEVAGLEAQINSKTAQIGLVTSEQQGVQTLYDKQLVPLTRLTSLQRESAHLEGDRAQLNYQIAETKSKISDAELQILRLDQDLRTEVMKDLGEAQVKEAELIERKIAADDQLNRIDIRAPTAGIVDELSVHTIAGVIKPGDVVLQIIPDSDDLVIESRLQTRDIDQVRVGQKTHVRLSAFNQQTTPQLDGTVMYVSADVSHEGQTGAAYYVVRVALPAEQVRRLGDLQLVSGMPAEVFLLTGSRTMLSYLVKPLTEQWHRTFNEF
jgi:HlyD family secretion protein